MTNSTSFVRVSATDFRVKLKDYLAGVKQGESYEIVKHSTVIGRLMAGNAVETPTTTISATNVRVKLKDVIVALDAGTTYHILKHKKVLASLVPAGFDVLTMVEEEDVVTDPPEETEEEAYNRTNDAMDALSDALQNELVTGTTDDLIYMDEDEEKEPATSLLIENNEDHLDTLSSKQLRDYADEHGIEVPARSTKEQVKSLIRSDMADMKIDDHDYLDEEHDDQYDAFFADLHKFSLKTLKQQTEEELIEIGRSINVTIEPGWHRIKMINAITQARR
jgi:antitoxin (DNA-binding transcriptional repressor) of toxin-antitoxin stability system